MKNYFFILLFFFSFTASSQSNYGISFDGTNDYVSIPHNNALNLSGSLTFEAWVNLTSTSAMYTILSKGDGNDNSTTNYIFNVGNNNSNGKVSLMIAGTWYTSNLTLSANTWYHCAVTVASNMVSFYVNGIAAGTSTISGSVYNSGTYTLKLGEQGDGCACSHMNGKMDEVRIWNVARTQAEIKANMFNKNLSNSASGLVAYYKMNEGSGTGTVNSSTNTSGIDGTLTNGPLWVASPIKFGGNALHFDQVDDRVLAPLATTAGTNVTMELWIYSEGGTGTDHLVIANGVMGTNGYAMYINTQNKLFVQFNGVNTWNTNSVIPANVWTHLALVITTTGFIVYQNGVNVYSNTGSPITPTTNFVLGFNTVANGQPFDGMMDEVRIWNTARTQTEIQNNMNGEIAPSTSGLALYYTFDQGIAGGTNTGLTTVIDQSGNNNGTLTNFALSGSTSNYLTQNSNLFILPLQWLSFTATKQNSHVLLQWSTSSEINTSDFWIGHSVDGKTWENIGTVFSENYAQQHYHSYVHSSPSAGINYYRIRQNDNDGRYSYSKIERVNISQGQQPFKVISNPVMNKVLQLEINASSNQTITLINSDGKILWRKGFTPGFHSASLNALSKGVYFLKSENYSEKLLVQ